jgi:hypothetical protein
LESGFGVAACRETRRRGSNCVSHVACRAAGRRRDAPNLRCMHIVV